MVPTLHGAYHMTRFNKALLASASLVVLTSVAQAQVYTPGQALQGIDLVDLDPISIANLAGAVGGGKGNATSEVVQIAAIALNQFGSSGAAVGVLGDYGVAQDFSFGVGEDISVLNLNGAFTPGGFSRAGGSQIISTAINNIGVDLKAGGQSFAAVQTFGPDILPPPPAPQASLEITQTNSLTAGYDTNNNLVGTGGSAIVGIPNVGSTGTSGLQVNALSINTVTVNLPDFNAAADIKIAQAADLTGVDVDLFNVADAGAMNSSTPTPPGQVIDPLVQNLQQIASFSANTATVTGGTTPGGQIDVHLGAAFDTTTTPYWTPVENQVIGGTGDVDLVNFASALTWARWTGPGAAWDIPVAGKGDVNIGGDYAAGVSGPVKQIAAFTVNSVSGPTSQGADLSTDAAKVFAGTIGVDPAGDVPLGLTAFQQVADLSDITIEGRWGTNGGAGVDLGSLLTIASVADGFPGWGGAGGIPVAPSAFDFERANNTAVAGTGAGNASIRNLDQITAISANSFSFDNSVRNSAGDITFANSDIVNGLVDQSALLNSDGYQLANLAVAVVGVKGTATLADVNQTNAFTVNSFSAGVADFKTGVVNPSDPSEYLQGGLSQKIDTNGAVLNLGNAAVAYGTNAIASNVKQVNAVSLNTATINTVSGGTISQSALGGINVNSGNYLSAVGSITASITGAQQIGVVNVNSIVGAPAK